MVSEAPHNVFPASNDLCPRTGGIYSFISFTHTTQSKPLGT